MKVPKCLYPKDAFTIKYWLHLGIDAVLFITLWLSIGQLVPSWFGFTMPPLTLQLLLKIILSPLTIVVWAILGVSDIISHSILKTN